MEKPTKKYIDNKYTKFVILGIIVLITFIIGYTAYINSHLKKWNNLIYPEVCVENIKLGGKTKAEAEEILKEKYKDNLFNKEIKVNASNKNFVVKYSDLDVKINYSKAIEEAFSYGKNFNIFHKSRIINKHNNNIIIKVKANYSKNQLKNYINNIEKQVNKEPKNATLDTSGNNIKLVKHKDGLKLDRNALEKSIVEKINGNTQEKAIVQAKMNIIKPHILEDKLKSINSKISSYSTEYGSISSYARSNNIAISTESINGITLMPGEEFSFNNVVGERTEERGYKAAPVIIGEQVESGLGGGICQVSSTLYNAILKANIKPVERTHHTLRSHYVPLGRDATVDYGNIDYKFKNTLPYPIYIEGYANGGMIGFNIYSNSSLNKRSYDIFSEVYQTIESSTSTIEDPNLSEGQVEVVQGSQTGYKVKVYKNTYENDKLISTEVISNDYYRPINGVVKKGTKKPVKEEEKKEVKPQPPLKDEDKNKKTQTPQVPQTPTDNKNKIENNNKN